MLSKLEIISNRLNTINNKNQLIISFMKKNKNYVLVRDNYITFKVFPRSLKCQCNVKLCDHILFALSRYKLSKISIAYLDIIDNLFDIFKNNDINEHIEYIINNYFSSHDCGICLEELSSNKYKYHLYQCKTCHNYIHSSCMEKWISFNKKKNEVFHGCIYCSTKIMDSFGEHQRKLEW